MGSIAKLSRNSFPDGFVFGSSSSAYQFEGETNKSGKGPNIWDTFIEEHPERISDHSNAKAAVDFYHRYKEDVQRMKGMGMDAFRFSISWSRVLPHGRLSAGINEEGIQFYNNLIDELIKNGIQPYVTLFHWDTPQAIEDKYGGFLSRNILNDFRDFVELCFQKFGDRVKHWITLNEPFMFSVNGYDTGTAAPGRVSTLENYPGQPKISGATEVYTVTHHLLLAHATAVKLYKEKYQTSQGGKIGITLVSHWFEPYSTSESDRMATKRSLDFMLGWYMDPVTKGDYPQNMHDYVGERLPKFSEEESKMLRGSYDFIGVNYYTTYYAQNVEDANYKTIGLMEDARVTWPGERNGIPIGPQAGSSWLYICPEGIRHLLNYIKDAYQNPTIYITENGVDDVNSSSLEEALNDHVREQYYKDIFDNVLESINDRGVDVKGFFAWSFSDDFEWGSGYSSRFGLYYIDYKDDLKRYAKNSVKWFKQFLHKDETKLINNIKSKSPSHPRMVEGSARSLKKSRIE
ncbi:beta-glucosidase [Salix suchowensis]|nr:beta-glucosidase [Salix suchowensis]